MAQVVQAVQAVQVAPRAPAAAPEFDGITAHCPTCAELGPSPGVREQAQGGYRPAVSKVRAGGRVGRWVVGWLGEESWGGEQRSLNGSTYTLREYMLALSLQSSSGPTWHSVSTLGGQNAM